MPQPAPPTKNGLATWSLVFGICSALVPLLCIPGIILGVRSLGRIKQYPSLPGRGRSIAGIVTSATIGPLAFGAAVVVFVLGVSNPQMSMPRVQSGIRSLLDAAIQQDYGVTPNLSVQCPGSEPRRAGTVFTCGILVVNTGARFTTQIHVTDTQGDFLIGPIQPVGGTSGSSSVPASVPPSQPVTPATTPDVPPVLTGTPSNGQVAVISVDTTSRHVTLDTGTNDVSYATCTQFQAVTPSGTQTGLSGIVAGDFATATINASVPCVSQITVLTPPAPPQCSSSGLPGSAVVTWEGFNQSAHSVLYLPSGPGESIVADRWCTSPTVVGANNAAMTLSQIPKGSQVQLLMSTNAGWVTSVSVKS